jgi:hypothetical protein
VSSLPASPGSLTADPSDWCAIAPELAATWLARVHAQWWIAGGSALDLFLGRTTRAHLDLDVGILRRDVAGVLKALSAWECYEVQDGLLRSLATEGAPRDDVHSLWCRPLGQTQWMLELMLDEAEGDEWVYRRDARVRRSLADIVRRDARGLPYLAPEVQLLYKAAHTRDKDEADFSSVLPHLDARARGWLLAALVTAHPAHAWISPLRNSKVT